MSLTLSSYLVCHVADILMDSEIDRGACLCFSVTSIYAFFCIYQVQTSSNDATSSHYGGLTEGLESTSFQGQFEGTNVKNGSNLLEEERLNSYQENTMLWLNDYKCSLCGIELPPSFVEERLEHSDFHLAEMLQKEESRIHQISVPSQRYNICLLLFALLFASGRYELDRV